MKRLLQGRGAQEVRSEAAGIPISLPPVQTLGVRLTGLSMVTRGQSSPVELSPVLERNRNCRLKEVNANTVVISVRDTVRALPVFEIIADWQMQITFAEHYPFMMQRRGTIIDTMAYDSMRQAGLQYRERVDIPHIAQRLAGSLR